MFAFRYATLLPTLVILTACTGVGVHGKDVLVTPGVCQEPPVGVASSKANFDLAGANIGYFSIGRLFMSYDPSFQQVLSQASTEALTLDYLVCKAIARAGVEQDAELVAYFTRLITFLNQKQRSMEEQTAWQAANPFPKKKGKLQLSGPRFDPTTNTRSLLIPKGAPIQKMGVINSGDGPLTWWFEHFPTGRFYCSFSIGSRMTLPAQGGYPFDIVKTAMVEMSSRDNFKIKDNTGEEVEVYLITSEDPYDTLGFELNERILRGAADFSNLTDSSFVLRQAQEFADERFPQAEHTAKAFLVSQLLIIAQFPEAALKAYSVAATLDRRLTDEGFERRYMEVPRDMASLNNTIQHLKWAASKGKQGDASELTLHTEMALKDTEEHGSLSNVSEVTVARIKEAVRNAKAGDTTSSTQNAEQALAQLMGPQALIGQHQQVRDPIPTL